MTAPPVFPGATLLVDGIAQIVSAWTGPAAPCRVASGDLFTALDIDERSPDAARVQLVLASAVGSPSEIWPIFAGDAPAVLQRGAGEPLIVTWQPAVEAGQIVGVYAYAIGCELPRADRDDPEELARICVECTALLDECEGSLRHLHHEPGARHAVHRLFRAIHTIKGATRGRSLDRVSELAHFTEDALERMRCASEVSADELLLLELELRKLRAAIAEARPRGDSSDAMTDLMTECRCALADLAIAIERHDGTGQLDRGSALGAIDQIANAAGRAKLRALALQCVAARNAVTMLAGGELDGALIAEVRALVDQLELYATVHREVASTPTGLSLIASVGPDDIEDLGDGYVHLASLFASAGVTSLATALGDETAVRRALAVVGDLAAMFEPARPRDDAALRFERAQRELLHAIDDISREVPGAALGEVRGIVQRLVWVPLTATARRLTRIGRSLAAELGKQFAVELELGDHCVAPPIARVLNDILVHAVRNAADHGIEPPDVREATGKPAQGTIRVHAAVRDDRLCVTVSDDGRGVALDRVRDIAIARGLVDATRSLSDMETLELLFAPGFSTARQVGAVSGRGVGMDVIRSLVEELGGHATLTTKPGGGTTLSFDLPVAA